LLLATFLASSKETKIIKKPLSDLTNDTPIFSQVRLRSLVRQLCSWAEQFPKARMSIGELKAVGKFVDFRSIVAKAVTFANEAVSAFEAKPSVATALAVRDAAIFGMTGGDGCVA
jgi:hypothetical protein